MKKSAKLFGRHKIWPFHLLLDLRTQEWTECKEVRFDITADLMVTVLHPTIVHPTMATVTLEEEEEEATLSTLHLLLELLELLDLEPASLPTEFWDERHDFMVAELNFVTNFKYLMHHIHIRYQ